MNTKKVKIFNAYNCDRLDDPFKYHNCIVKKNGKIKDNIIPLDEEIDEKELWELDDEEKAVLQMLKSSVEQAKDIYDSALRKQRRYENILIQKVCDEMKIDVCDILLSNDKCDLSPIGKCAYYCDCEPTCIFCGEPEERK